MTAADAVVRVHAPGKAVVLGEYAVLDGAPSLVVAVPFGVGCEVTPGGPRRTSAPGDTRFVDAALDAEGVHTGAFAFRDAPPLDLPSKPGLGGSAAATVAATFAARALRGGDVSPAAVFRAADAVHRAVQGSGSGVDVAASSYGGLLRFTRGHDPAPVPSVPLVVVFSGTSARTGPRVAAYQAWAGRGAFVDASTELVRGFAGDPVAALREGRRLLEAMADAAGLAYRTEALTALCDLAEAHGGGAKPSGAGGGDCAVACFPDADAAHAYADAARRAGFAVLSATPSPGVRVVDALPA